MSRLDLTSNRPRPEVPRGAGLAIALLAATLPLAALAAPEVYSGVDPGPGTTPVIEGARFAPREVEVPALEERPARPEPKVSVAAQGKPAAQRTALGEAKEPPSRPIPTPQARTPDAPKPRAQNANSARDRQTRSALQKEIAALRREVDRLQTQRDSQKATALETCSAPANDGNYDPVPSDQADTVARRLGIVARLILTHGRAYDYRSHTTQELREILDQLDQAAAPQGR